MLMAKLKQRYWLKKTKKQQHNNINSKFVKDLQESRWDQRSEQYGKVQKVKAQGIRGNDLIHVPAYVFVPMENVQMKKQ